MNNDNLWIKFDKKDRPSSTGPGSYYASTLKFIAEGKKEQLDVLTTAIFDAIAKIKQGKL